MKKNRAYFCALIILTAIAVCACVSAQPMMMADNSRTSLDWAGNYIGRIPSASGTGINVQITLRNDETFTIVYSYVDRQSIMTGSGTFTWNEAGNIITFNRTDFPPHYRVGEGHLLQLDLSGRIITGNLADQYVLRKID
jgi:uncharacterized lipoprotein NlpE involved in copper resistance